MRPNLPTLDETKRDHISKHEKKQKETTSANIRGNKRRSHMQTADEAKEDHICKQQMDQKETISANSR